MPHESLDGIPVVGGAGGGLRFELALAEGEPLEARDGPFLPLDDSGRYSRVLLGQIALGRDTILRSLAVKILRSGYRPGKGLLTNPQVEDLWKRKREALLASAGQGIAPLVDLGEEGFSSPPITFCRKVRKYFHPPCPTGCGGPLRDCRDDTLLRELGLPEHSKTAARYLHCPACLAGGKPKILYTTAPASEENPRGGVQVRRRSELYRDFAALVGQPPAGGERARLARTFPCLECPFREECYPAATPAGQAVPAESRLVPLSYYDCRMLALEAAELHYDEFSDLLGGATWAEIRGRVRQAGAAGREPLLAPLDEIFDTGVQWLCQHDRTGRFLAEVVWLKLTLFSETCRAVRELHARTRAPHLNLDPKKQMVRMSPGPSAMPARWGFQVRLVGVGGTHRSIPAADPGETGGRFLCPPPDADPIFVSPYVRDANLGHEEPMRVSVRSVRPEGPRVRLEGTLHSDRARLEPYLAGDVIRLVSSSAGDLENLPIWGTLGERDGKALRFAALLPGEAPRLDAVKAPFDLDATVTFFRNLHVPCDLYALGMLLFRALLVNDEQDLLAVDAAVHRLLKKLGLWFEGKRGPTVSHITTQLLSFLGEEREVFDSASPLYASDDRESSAGPLPARLWQDLLLLGFRLMTDLPGFSFCSHHADYPAEHPEGLLNRVVEEVDGIIARAAIELFRRGERDREISDVCTELLGELAALEGGGSPEEKA